MLDDLITNNINNTYKNNTTDKFKILEDKFRFVLPWKCVTLNKHSNQTLNIFNNNVIVLIICIRKTFIYEQLLLP